MTEATGPDTLIHVQLNDTEVTCRSSPACAGTPGQRMELALDNSKILFFDPQTEQRLDRYPSLKTCLSGPYPMILAGI